MKPETTHDVPLTEAEAQDGRPQDRLVKLLNLGFSRAEVVYDITEKCSMSFHKSKSPKKHNQALADLIAQIDCINVFATGTIPEGV